VRQGLPADLHPTASRHFWETAKTAVRKYRHVGALAGVVIFAIASALQALLA
jgi:hypothetical protein